MTTWKCPCGTLNNGDVTPCHCGGNRSEGEQSRCTVCGLHWWPPSDACPACEAKRLMELCDDLRGALSDYMLIGQWDNNQDNGYKCISCGRRGIDASMQHAERCILYAGPLTEER